MTQLIKPLKRPLFKSAFTKVEPNVESSKPQTDITKLRIDGNHWLSQIDAITVQLKVFKDKINQAVIAGRLKDMIRTQSLSEQLSRLETAEKELSRKIRKHLKYLDMLFKRSKIKNGIVFSTLHTRMEDEIKDFVRTFTSVRRDFIMIKQQEEWDVEKQLQ